jgi:uncharacterized membrane protein YidH (DUF202 family)
MSVPRVPGGGDTAGPSDPGLAGERTSLAWSRIGLSLLAVPAGVLAYARSQDGLVVAAAAAALGTVTGLLLVVGALRHQRAQANMVEQGGLPTAAPQVALSATTVLLLAVAAVDLIAAQ